ncbi:hypothetical protein [Helicobacter zhangjianzhongii]|uniref:Uncharacterized protein n=1 Tax=Helicobacter zhangjianzhongii TaxID=2974574 RepID=A0ACC6FSL4_9HELI|nr:MULTISPECIES: hypothetical protein [unclassified Helicobacter]MDL0080208.1 hypothetical protein [Helicobacter sp. CPD2-1]MDL0082269.1 hypothetical protein [Helicobacter sp. XJK30-2]
MTERGRCSRIHFLRSAFSKETSPSGERYPLFSKKTSLRLFCVSKIAAIHRIHFFTCGGFLSLQDTALAWRSTPRPLSLRAVLLHRVAIHFQKVDSSVDYF